MDLPETLRQVTSRREGARGDAWLAALPSLVDEYLQRWSCVPTDGAVSGKVGIVVPARSAAHGEVVLKISFPHPANVHEPDAFAHWRGQGAVRLHERDDERFAMLLERAGPGTLRDVEDLDEAVAIAGGFAHRLAVPAPEHLPRLSDQADEWAKTVRRAADRLPQRAIEMAAASIRELCECQPETMVHGDLHAGNVLRGVREPWQVIDPKGVVGDPAHDAITFIRTRAGTVLGSPDLKQRLLRWVAIFAESAQLEHEHVLRWAQMRSVVIAQTSWERADEQWIREANDMLAGWLTR